MTLTADREAPIFGPLPAVARGSPQVQSASRLVLGFLQALPRQPAVERPVLEVGYRSRHQGDADQTDDDAPSGPVVRRILLLEELAPDDAGGVG